jgi:hypothetical protein
MYRDMCASQVLTLGSQDSYGCLGFTCLPAHVCLLMYRDMCLTGGELSCDSSTAGVQAAAQRAHPSGRCDRKVVGVHITEVYVGRNANL